MRSGWLVVPMLLVACGQAARPEEARTVHVQTRVAAPAPAAPPPATPPAAPSLEPASAVLGDLFPWPQAVGARLAREAAAIPPGELRTPAPDAERDAAIAARFGHECRLERTCGPLWGVDCNAATDGPYYYVRLFPDHAETITTCGGACMGGRCTDCPPRDAGWTCPTY